MWSDMLLIVIIEVKSCPIILIHIVQNDNDYYRTKMITTVWVLWYERHRNKDKRIAIRSNQIKSIPYNTIQCNQVKYNFNKYDSMNHWLQWDTTQNDIVDWNWVQQRSYDMIGCAPLISYQLWR